MVKINTDACYDVTNGKAGLGCVIRNHNGFTKMQLELDSLIIVVMLNNRDTSKL